MEAANSMSTSTTSRLSNGAHPRGDASGPPAAAQQLVGRWAAATGQTLAAWASKKYALPDKTVASQVLMYRQLLHTACKPGLKLSRPYQNTPAQASVRHMPWWEKAVDAETGAILSMEQTGKMVISYDNLIARLWTTGTTPAQSGAAAAARANFVTNDDVFAAAPTSDATGEIATVASSLQSQPPIPHEYWVSRLGFQQRDPVTDFRSGGVLSLAMMVWIVESCPDTYRRFCKESGDPAAVLPFGITSINVTDMMAKFLMLSKSTDRMDALLSQKPFWQMFSDPNALLTCQELALDMLCDVVAELVAARDGAPVTVFDFSHILKVTEQRVEHDLLGAGPVSVRELRLIHAKLRLKYRRQLSHTLERRRRQPIERAIADGGGGGGNAASDAPQSPPEPSRLHEQVLKHATGMGAAATGLAGSVFSKIKASPGTFRLSSPARADEATADITTTTIDFATPPTLDFATPPTLDFATVSTLPAAAAVVVEEEDLLNFGCDDDGDWVGTAVDDLQAVPLDLVSHFSIGSHEDEDDDNAFL